MKLVSERERELLINGVWINDPLTEDDLRVMKERYGDSGKLYKQFLSAIDATLSDLGKIISMTTHPHLPPQYHILLHRPVPVYEPHSAPDCCFISRLWACTKWDYLRTEGSIVMEAKDIIRVRFVDRPVAWWIGKGRLAKKAVEAVDVAVEGERGLELFVELSKIGFAYEGATRRRRKK